jgi:hypothetical protein
VKQKSWKRGGIDYRYLAINTGLRTSIYNTYILFLTKMQKGKSYEMNLPLMKKRYHKNFEALIFTFS